MSAIRENFAWVAARVSGGPRGRYGGAMAAPSSSPRALSDPPGGVLLWLIVTVELMTFAMVFGLIAHLRHGEPALFAQGQALLHARIGLGLTAALVTSGALAAQAVHRYRQGALAAARRLFLGAGAVGLAFVALKVLDTAQLVGHGVGLGTSDFWGAYFFATGFHFAHVLVGLTLLFFVAARVGRTTFADEEGAVVGSALFWHLCDVAWFFLFPLFFAGAR